MSALATLIEAPMHAMHIVSSNQYLLISFALHLLGSMKPSYFNNDRTIPCSHTRNKVSIYVNAA